MKNACALLLFVLCIFACRSTTFQAINKDKVSTIVKTLMVEGEYCTTNTTSSEYNYLKIDKEWIAIDEEIITGKKIKYLQEGNDWFQQDMNGNYRLLFSVDSFEQNHSFKWYNYKVIGNEIYTGCNYAQPWKKESYKNMDIYKLKIFMKEESQARHIVWFNPKYGLVGSQNNEKWEQGDCRVIPQKIIEIDYLGKSKILFPL